MTMSAISHQRTSFAADIYGAHHADCVRRAWGGFASDPGFANRAGGRVEVATRGALGLGLSHYRARKPFACL